MRIARTFVAIALAAALVIAFMPMMGQVNAASKKKTVYVVKSIKIKDKSGKKNTLKVKYNKNGTLKKITDSREDEVKTFTYGKAGEIKTFNDVINKGDWKGFHERATYTWKNGKMMQKKLTRVDKGGNDKEEYNYTWKNGKIVTCNDTTMYTYKKGHIYEMTFRAEGQSITATQHMDSKGNVIKCGEKKGGYGGYYIAKITYKKGRISKMKTERWNPMMAKNKDVRGDNAAIETQTVTYEKKKVDKSMADIVEAQQWKLLNGPAVEDLTW